jgi:hypothetical protein
MGLAFLFSWIGIAAGSAALSKATIATTFAVYQYIALIFLQVIS